MAFGQSPAALTPSSSPRNRGSPKKVLPSINAAVLIGRGHMGRHVHNILRDELKAEVVILHSQSKSADWEQCRRADILIDFSDASAVRSTCERACAFKKPLVVGTTGWEKELESMQKMVLNASIACLHSPNFSWGIYALRRALIQMANLSPLLPISDVALHETHRSGKVDAPSGTALQLAKDAKELFDLPGVHTNSQRIGDAPGRHVLILDGQEETLELSHTAKTRLCFARGAVAGSQWLLRQRPGWYTMDDVAEQTIS